MNCSCLGGFESESHLTFDLFLDGLEHSDDLDTEEVPPYEDRLGPDGSVEQLSVNRDSFSLLSNIAGPKERTPTCHSKAQET